MIAQRAAIAVLILLMSACRFQPDRNDRQAVRIEETTLEGRARDILSEAGFHKASFETMPVRMEEAFIYLVNAEARKELTQ